MNSAIVRYNLFPSIFVDYNI